MPDKINTGKFYSLMEDRFYRINLKQADVKFIPKWIDAHQASEWLNNLKTLCQWRSDKITLFGKQVNQPRLVAWYGEPEAIIRYSGIEMRPLPWLECLMAIKNAVEKTTQSSFNGVLINWYRNGYDSMGWHSDDEKELGFEPTIASVSLGATRKFQFKHKQDKNLKADLHLINGSLLVMAGATQTYYKHQIPKTTVPTGERINLTFRKIIG